MELREGYEFALAGTPCEHAYEHELLLVRRGARLRYPADQFLRAHCLDGYLAIPLHGADGRAIGHIGVISTRPLDPLPSELQALQVFAARAAAELERRRHERALRAARRRGRGLARPRRPRRRRGAPADRPRPARRRAAAARRPRPGARPRAARARTATPSRRSSASPPRASRRPSPAASCASSPAACTRSGSSAACAGRSPRSPPSRRCRCTIDALPERRLPAVVETTIWFLVSEALSNAIKHAEATAADGATSCCTAARWSRPSPTTARAAPAPTRGTGLQGLAARVESLGGRLKVESPEGQGTTLTATIPLAPWRTAAEAFLEFGHDGDEGRGLRKIEELLAGTRTTGVSLAREWELEGGPPRIGQRLPVFDHTGRRHGARRGRPRRGHAVRRDRPARRSIPSRARPTGTPPARRPTTSAARRSPRCSASRTGT